MVPIFMKLAAILSLLMLNLRMVQSQKGDPRLAEELKCLASAPSDMCNLQVTYDAPLGTLKCNQKVEESNGEAMSQPPTLAVPPGIEATLQRWLGLMFDPDAPISSRPQDGFIHWLAEFTVDSQGKLKMEKEHTEYYPPMPPKGNGEHRYQFFLFRYVKSPVFDSGRLFQLCPFVTANNMSQPVAAFQFRFERK